ncbi:MAG: hypothetical protein AB8C13_02365 [Phycisphaerales bacterium]
MHLRWHKIEDDRGKKHKPCTIREVSKSSGMDRVGFVRPGDAGRFWPVFLMSGTLYTIGLQIFFLVLGTDMRDFVFTPSWFMINAFLFVGFGVPVGLVIRLVGWNSAEHAKRAVLSIGYCPSCTYRLFDLQTEDDGCVVCPECSGAWKVQ